MLPAHSVNPGWSRVSHTPEPSEREKSTIRVITAPNYGGPEVLRVEERPAPQPQADEALVEVKASGVNLMDMYARRGTLKMFSLPPSLGVDRRAS